MISVVVPTWRLGGLDVVTAALAAQRDVHFELIVVDALHRWRAPLVRERLESLRYPVVHVGVDQSLFPIACPYRARNTGIRRAKGDRVVFLCDHASPPPDFLRQHAALGPDVAGVSCCHAYTLPEGAWKLPSIQWNEYEHAWSVVVEGARSAGLCWSVLREGWQSFDGVRSARCPICENGTVPPDRMEVPYKADSVPRAWLESTNGFDEAMDGNDFGDVELTARLCAAGLRFEIVGGEVLVPDPHPLMHRLIIDEVRPNRARLAASLRSKRVRCALGLVYDPSEPPWPTARITKEIPMSKLPPPKTPAPPPLAEVVEPGPRLKEAVEPETLASPGAFPTHHPDQFDAQGRHLDDVLADDVRAAAAAAGRPVLILRVQSGAELLEAARQEKMDGCEVLVSNWHSAVGVAEAAAALGLEYVRRGYGWVHCRKAP